MDKQGSADQELVKMVQVPMSTARQVTEAREHLTVAAKSLVTAARVVKPYSPDSSVIALHIEQQVTALAKRIDDLLDGLEVVYGERTAGGFR